MVASPLVKSIISLNLSFPPVKQAQFSPNRTVTFEVHGRLWLIRGGNLIFCSSPRTCTFSLKRCLTLFGQGDDCSSPGHQQMAPNNVGADNKVPSAPQPSRSPSSPGPFPAPSQPSSFSQSVQDPGRKSHRILCVCQQIPGRSR